MPLYTDQTQARRMRGPGTPALHSSLLLLACFTSGLDKAHTPASLSRGSVGFPCFLCPGFKSGRGPKPRTNVRPGLPPLSTTALAVCWPEPEKGCFACFVQVCGFLGQEVNLVAVTPSWPDMDAEHGPGSGPQLCCLPDPATSVSVPYLSHCRLSREPRRTQHRRRGARRVERVSARRPW